MTEQEYIAWQQAKCDKRLLRQLQRVHKSGDCGREASEVLSANDLAYFGPPRPDINNPYNCWRLTQKGKDVLRTLSQK